MSRFPKIVRVLKHRPFIVKLPEKSANSGDLFIAGFCLAHCCQRD
jgi:hypothetical protein